MSDKNPVKLAIVGSRKGADLEHVREFVRALPKGTTVVSGGAQGVDEAAERGWRELGGSVVSLRPHRKLSGDYGVQRVELSNSGSSSVDLYDGPSFEDYGSAAIYRDMLIAQEADRLVAFTRKGGSRGTGHTVQFSRNEGKPTFVFEAA